MKNKKSTGCYLPGWAVAGFLILWMMGQFWYGLLLLLIVYLICKKAGK
jgi:hypothetical protein